ncbi:T-complex protein 1, variant [Loa loa]|uniref:T-complex protein 1 subunit gamma n=1 Tax=Loa loa TaxID=7209 RepID=A0A1S0UGM3_LOALO|nr:T-complex protein 1 [Loa loa]XP_020304949.1 T-complex protein 1, variant [Loa loa]EJD74006.1 T-complex protein 1 [Loa loa]EJD74007.1 T-complex protein 1, variant [Loa loa]
MIRAGGATPIIVLSQNTTRESGHQVQAGNIAAAKTIADVIRTSLGPRAMLKMLMDPMGGIVITNDGNAILREITVKHPAAKSIIEIARTQDEETGDGTTSVIVLAGEVMSQAQQFLDQNIHPTIIIQAYRMALEDMIVLAEEKFSKQIDVNNDDEVTSVIKSCLGTKMLSKWMDLAVKMALNAVKTIRIIEHGHQEIDIKRYCRIEKIPGGRIEDSQVIKGVVLNKDVTHAKMLRRKEKPRVVLLDCNLEYKKGESQMALEIMKEEDFSKVLEQEEDAIKKMCDDIIAVKPDVVFTEKGVSDLAQHFLLKAGVTAIRRLKKTENNRLARVTGATIVNDTQDLREEDVGTHADLFEIKKIGDEYYTYVTSEKATAVTVVLRGPSKDIINELERNLQDALNVVRNIMVNPRLVPGGGAIEMALAQALNEKGKSIEGVRQWPYKAAAHALEVIPRTLVQNCGGSTIRQLTALRAKHAQAASNWTWGIDGCTGQLADMNELNIWDPLSVRLQVMKTAIETGVLLLRIDDIVSGTKKRDGTDSSSGNPVADS